MKIVFVDKPIKMIGDTTEWCVRSELMKTNQSFQQWLIEKSEWIENHPKATAIKGLYIYDFTPCALNEKQAGMMIRYDYIKV